MNMNGNSLFKNEMAQGYASNLSDLGIKSLFKLVIMIDASDKFPKNYHFMENAVIKWLTAEYTKIKDGTASF